VLVLADITKFLIFLSIDCHLLLVLVLLDCELVHFPIVVSDGFFKREHLNRLSCKLLSVEILEHLAFLIQKFFWVETENAYILALAFCLLFDPILLDNHIRGFS
jgi:hypothetical protein